MTYSVIPINSHGDVPVALVGQSVTDGTYVTAKMTPIGGLVINQDMIDATNSSTSNLAPGATFIGVTANNIIASAIQVMLKTDKNCIVHVDQSSDGVNWDVSDVYNFYDTVGNFAIIVTSVGAFYRVRVTNTDIDAPTTYLRLQTTLVPIMSALPRSLDSEGHLEVGIKSFTDDNEFLEYLSPHGEQVTVPLYRLIGSVFNGNVLDTNFWTISSGTGGTVAVTNGLLTMSTGVTTNNVTSLRTNRIARYVADQPNKFRAVFRLPDTGTVNNTRRWGIYTATDGAFFELLGTTFSLVTRKNSVDTKVVNGSFNGFKGDEVILDTAYHVWEIIITPMKTYWMLDSVLIHTTTTTTTSLMATLDLPIMFENFNTGGSTSNVSMSILSAAILRMGLPLTQPVSYFISGITAGVTIKNGSGNLHGLIIGDNSGTMTIYDSLSASGTIISQLTPSSVASMDFKGISFSIGLTIVTTDPAGRWTILYE
jgi:hypothetical protein